MTRSTGLNYSQGVELSRRVDPGAFQVSLVLTVRLHSLRISKLYSNDPTPNLDRSFSFCKIKINTMGPSKHVNINRSFELRTFVR